MKKITLGWNQNKELFRILPWPKIVFDNIVKQHWQMLTFWLSTSIDGTSSFKHDNNMFSVNSIQEKWANEEEAHNHPHTFVVWHKNEWNWEILHKLAFFIMQNKQLQK